MPSLLLLLSFSPAFAEISLVSCSVVYGPSAGAPVWNQSAPSGEPNGDRPAHLKQELGLAWETGNLALGIAPSVRIAPREVALDDPAVFARWQATERLTLEAGLLAPVSRASRRARSWVTATAAVSSAYPLAGRFSFALLSGVTLRAGGATWDAPRSTAFLAPGLGWFADAWRGALFLETGAANRAFNEAWAGTGYEARLELAYVGRIAEIGLVPAWRLGVPWPRALELGAEARFRVSISN